MRKMIATILIVIILIVGGGYLTWTYVLPNSFLCSQSGSKYIPTCNYSATFTLSVNYTGSWTAQYYGYHGVSGVFMSNGSFTGGKYSGAGFDSRSITLNAPVTFGLGLCFQAQKLDQSQSKLTITLQYDYGAALGSNSTSTPLGTTFICGGVSP